MGEAGPSFLHPYPSAAYMGSVVIQPSDLVVNSRSSCSGHLDNVRYVEEPKNILEHRGEANRNTLVSGSFRLLLTSWVDKGGHVAWCLGSSVIANQQSQLVVLASPS